jgi:hypothetical protein
MFALMNRSSKEWRSECIVWHLKLYNVHDRCVVGSKLKRKRASHEETLLVVKIKVGQT